MRRARARSNSLDDRDGIRTLPGESAQIGHELGVAGAQDDDPTAFHEQILRRPGQQVEAFLRIQPADHAQHRALVGRIESDLGQQRPAAFRLACQVAPRVVRRQRLVGGRIPCGRVEAVQDPTEAMAEAGQHVLQAHTEGRGHNLRGVAGADGVHQLGPLDPLAQEQQPVRVRTHQLGDLVRRGEARQLFAREPALVGQVVDRDHDRRARDPRIAGIGDVAQQDGRHRLPVVEVQHVHRAVVVEESLERGPAQQPESPAVVGVVAIVVAVEALAIEGRRVVDQADAIASRFELDEVDLRRALGSQRVGHGERSARRAIWHGHAPVQRQEDVDGSLDVGHYAARRLAHDGTRAEPDLRLHHVFDGRIRGLRLTDRGHRPGQRVDDVPQPARLGPRLAFGGDADDAHPVAPMFGAARGPRRRAA